MAESEISNIKGVGPKAAKTLEDCGYNTVEKIAKTKAEEMAQLPGIGHATAEKIIEAAKELVKTKAPKKKPAAKPKPTTKPAMKEEKIEKPIPKPPAIKKAVTEKPPSKTTVRPSVKKPVSKPVAKPLEKHVKISVTSSTQREIERARAIPKIKPKRKSIQKKTKKKAKIPSTYGVIRRIIHDRAGRTKNRSVILNLPEIEVPLEKYLGRKVRVQMKSGKELIGTISKIHGRRTSKENSVVVRFNKSVSPHIITSKAEIL